MPKMGWLTTESGERVLVMELFKAGSKKKLEPVDKRIEDSTAKAGRMAGLDIAARITNAGYTPHNDTVGLIRQRDGSLRPIAHDLSKNVAQKLRQLRLTPVDAAADIGILIDYWFPRHERSEALDTLLPKIEKRKIQALLAKKRSSGQYPFTK